MRILKLETLNLASLEGENVIPFEEGLLRDSQIFSIVGPTGSGKSTILDAICLALYGRAPRYPMRKGEKRKRIEIIGESDDDEKNRLSPVDARNILSRGTKQGYSRLTFQANDGKVYRAEWSVVFKVKNYGNAQKNLVLLTKDADGNPVEQVCDWASLETIIGLDFDQFLRTVLIAQGSFATFLEASESERYHLLEKLVGNERIYSRIAAEIVEGKRAAENDYERMNARCEAFEKDLLTPDELEALNKAICELEAWERQLAAEVKRIDECLKWYADDERQTADLLVFKTKHDEALQAFQSIRGAMRRLALHDATIEAVGVYKDIQQNRNNAGRLKEERSAVATLVKQKTDAMEEQNRLLEDLKAKAETANGQMERMAPRIQAARILKAELDNALKNEREKKVALDESRLVLAKAQQDLADNAETILKTEESLASAKDALQKLITETDERKRALADALGEVRQSLMAAEEGLKNINLDDLQAVKSTADADFRDLEKAIDIQQAMARKKTDERKKQAIFEQQEKDRLALAETLKTLETADLEKEVETLAATVTLMSSEKWVLHRHQLVEGQPCPLCGSPHHPYADDGVVAPVLHQMDELLRQKKNALSLVLEQRTTLGQQMAAIEGRQKELAQTLKGFQREMGEYGGRWSALAAVHPAWPSDVEALGDLKPKLESAKQKTDEALKDYQRKTKHMADLRRKKDDAERSINDYKELADKQLRESDEAIKKLQMTLVSHQAKTVNLQQQQIEKQQAAELAEQKHLAAQSEKASRQEAYRQALDGRNPDDVETELAQAKKKADDDVAKKEHLLADLKNERGRLEGRQESMRHQAESLEQERIAFGKQLNEWLEDFNRQERHSDLLLQGQRLSEADIAELAQATDPWDDIRADKAHKEAALIQAATTLDNAERAHQTHQQGKPSDEKNVLDMRKTELASQSRQQELVEGKARLQRYDDACRQLGPLKEQLEASLELLNDWKDIYAAIGGNTEGSDLRKIVQCYTLRFLVAHANAQIAQFNNRYQLVQVRNSLGLRVIDHDRGDDIRDITSLSGGETFIVSLGLALGLSSLSSRNISFANLFIDEGFGTLDADTLATVIDALSMLQTAQGKKVCVISHTDTMSERITTQIRVSKNGDTGTSRIEIVGG